MFTVSHWLDYSKTLSNNINIVFGDNKQLIGLLLTNYHKLIDSTSIYNIAYCYYIEKNTEILAGIWAGIRQIDFHATNWKRECTQPKSLLLKKKH